MTTATNRPRRSLRERFAEKTDRTAGPTGCWEWTGFRGPKGYGTVHVCDRRYHTQRASRVAWELEYGAVPAGLHVLHTCDNPPCVNPAHLRLGTNKDNVDDRERKGRNKVPLNRFVLAKVAAGEITESEARALWGDR